jgi:uncharacterized phiE125 gp8 family phage protein
MMQYRPVLITAPDPADQPLTLDMAKTHLRVDHEDDDAYIAMLVGAVIAHADGPSGWLARALAPQAWRQDFDAFAPCMMLSLAPVIAISSLQYFGSDGLLATVDPTDYWVDDPIDAPCVRMISTFTAPILQDQAPRVRVTFSAGYAAGDLPESIKAALLLMVGDLYQRREILSDGQVAESPVYRRLLDPYRRGWIA